MFIENRVYLLKREFLESLPGGELPKSITLDINREANSRFRSDELEVGQLVGTLECGNNNKAYKVWEIHEDTVVVSLPDLVMQTVSKTSLYDPHICMDIFWEGPYGLE
jgi:hypothetical protein